MKTIYKEQYLWIHNYQQDLQVILIIYILLQHQELIEKQKKIDQREWIL